MDRKIIIYQVFVRLFGNTITTNRPWGTIEENGVGKFADITQKALEKIKELGITHIWYTGVLHHALIRDYTCIGIKNDDPNIVKGRAGSPYAIKDYYNVNPDLAVDPSNRLEEFKSLVRRTHDADMKVIIDVVPNHVSRCYHGITNPDGVLDFGAQDDTTVTYARHNNYYYNPGVPFQLPDWRDAYQPLGGNPSETEYEQFVEYPAKWTGNGSRSSKPDFHDWYETVKINYGISPEGQKDFDLLPQEFRDKGINAHYTFWKNKPVPDSWKKFKDIASYWLSLGVDGFRYDMAEMVPVEFWSYLNSFIKTTSPEALLIAEVYNPDLYRDYIHLGKMDYLYDKVDLYDGLKHIMKGYGWTDHIPVVQRNLVDIEHHMLHFLENHDEQRIASPEFVGDPRVAMPAMVVSTTIGTSPTMIYFGQEVGEPAADKAGFGSPSRTSIFDYIGVPNHQRWVNEGKFDGGQLSNEEKTLRDFYIRLINFTTSSSALMGAYQEIHFYNKDHTPNYDHRVLSYLRWSDEEKLIIISNFDKEKEYAFTLRIPEDIVSTWNLKESQYFLAEQLYQLCNPILTVKNGTGFVDIQLNPLESMILKLRN